MQPAPSDASLRIRVSAPKAPDREFRIRKPVVRVGSSPDCEVSIPLDGIALHALTLQREQQNLTVMVRSAQLVLISGNAIALKGSTRWAPGEPLQIDGLVTLQFDFVADNEKPEPVRYSPPPFQKQEASNPSKLPMPAPLRIGKSDSRLNLKVLIESIIGLIMCVTFLLLFTGQLHRFRDSLKYHQVSQSHAELIKEIDEKALGDENDAEKPKDDSQKTDPFWLETREQLQVAYRFEMAKNADKAKAIYRAVLAKLLERSPIPTRIPPPDGQQPTQQAIDEMFSDPLEKKLAKFLIAKS